MRRLLRWGAGGGPDRVHSWDSEDSGEAGDGPEKPGDKPKWGIDDLYGMVGSPSLLPPAKDELTSTQPLCKGCKRSWRFPRNLAHVSRSQVPDHIEPNTKLAVIAHQNTVHHVHHGLAPSLGEGIRESRPTMCEELFRKLHFVHTQEDRGWRPKLRNKLVEEFEYHPETGEVKYDLTGGHGSDNFQFARLVTLPAWYVNLMMSMVMGSLSFMDHYANFILVLQVLIEKPDWLSNFEFTPYIFSFGWLVMIVGCVGVSAFAAYKEWIIKADHRVGDLSISCSLYDKVMAFAALTLFSFFFVENQIKDIVIHLHPWKSIQPYAAFKCEGVRAYALGYKSEALYRVENQVGQFHAMLLQSVLRSFVFGFKLWIAGWTWWLDGHFHLNLIVSCFSSVGSILAMWRSLFLLSCFRSTLYEDLMHMLAKANNDVFTNGDNPIHERQVQAAKKLLAIHFGSSYRRMLKKHHPSQSHECHQCGRDLPKTAPPKKEVTVRFREGSMVRLSEDYTSCHDAQYGPLQPEGAEVEKVGTVLRQGPWIEGIGYRYLIQCMAGGEDWWYDQVALQPVDGIEQSAKTLRIAAFGDAARRRPLVDTLLENNNAEQSKECTKGDPEFPSYCRDAAEADSPDPAGCGGEEDIEAELDAELERLEQKLRAARGNACADKFRRVNRQLLDVEFRQRNAAWAKLRALQALGPGAASDRD